MTPEKIKTIITTAKRLLTIVSLKTEGKRSDVEELKRALATSTGEQNENEQNQTAESG